MNNNSGTLKSGSNNVRRREGYFLEHGGLGKSGDLQISYGDCGGASRFFYCPKASPSEKEEYNTHLTVKPLKLIKGYPVDYIGFDKDRKSYEIAKRRIHYKKDVI